MAHRFRCEGRQNRRKGFDTGNCLELKKPWHKSQALKCYSQEILIRPFRFRSAGKILQAKPALVLSLHVNAGFNKSSSGFELYYPGFASGGTVNGKNSNKATDDAEKKYLNDTVKLARLIQKNLDNLFLRKGRGLREAPVPLAEGLKIPVLVVELGFVTNADDKKKLVSARTQKEIAGALAASIRTFF